MSLIVKIALPVIVAVAAIWGYLTYTHPVAMESNQDMQQQVPAAGDMGTNTGADTQVSARGSSDADLQADLGSIDTQLQAASDSSAAVGTSMQDSAGDTSY